MALIKMTSEECIQLLQSYEEAMYRIAKGILVEEEDCKDALQEAVIRVYKHRDKIKDQSYFKTWVLRITINECNRIYRKRRNWVPLCFVSSYAVKEKDLEGYIDLHNAIRELDKKYRDPLVLYYFGGCNYEEIGLIFKIPVGTVKSRLYYAKSKLRERLGEVYESK